MFYDYFIKSPNSLNFLINLTISLLSRTIYVKILIFGFIGKQNIKNQCIKIFCKNNVYHLFHSFAREYASNEDCQTNFTYLSLLIDKVLTILNPFSLVLFLETLFKFCCKY